MVLIDFGKAKYSCSSNRLCRSEHHVDYSRTPSSGMDRLYDEYIHCSRSTSTTLPSSVLDSEEELPKSYLYSGSEIEKGNKSEGGLSKDPWTHQVNEILLAINFGKFICFV